MPRNIRRDWRRRCHFRHRCAKFQLLKRLRSEPAAAIGQTNGINPGQINVTQGSPNLQEQMLLQGQVDSVAAFTAMRYMNRSRSGSAPTRISAGCITPTLVSTFIPMASWYRRNSSGSTRRRSKASVVRPAGGARFREIFDHAFLHAAGDRPMSNDTFAHHRLRARDRHGAAVGRRAGHHDRGHELYFDRTGLGTVHGSVAGDAGAGQRARSRTADQHQFDRRRRQAA